MEVEVRAAQNVLEACAQTVTMERVVFTSSVTAVVWKDDHKLVDAFDERNWSDLNLCRKRKVIKSIKRPSPAHSFIREHRSFFLLGQELRQSCCETQQALEWTRKAGELHACPVTNPTTSETILLRNPARKESGLPDPKKATRQSRRSWR